MIFLADDSKQVGPEINIDKMDADQIIFLLESKGILKNEPMKMTEMNAEGKTSEEKEL